MKKLNVFFSILALTSCIKVNAQLKMDSYGNVGIGVNPGGAYRLTAGGTRIYQHIFDEPGLNLTAYSGHDAPALYINGSGSQYKIWINGSAYASGGTWQSSDLRLKKNVANLDGAEMLTKLMKINGTQYEFKNASELKTLYSKNDSMYMPEFSSGRKYGLIAQEVEVEFPELVREDSKTKLKAINYDCMIPILLEAIKNQQNTIIKMQAEINKLKEVSDLKSSSSPGEYNVATNSLQNSLAQNTPNPFRENTLIQYYLSENIRNAVINIYNMNGAQLKSIAIDQLGSGSITINGGEFNPGIYLYSLVADGQLIDTKRMVLTD